MPSTVWMRCPQYSLGKDQVDDEQQYHARRDEDAGRNSDTDILEPTGPDDAHDACGDACHAETEHQSGHDELVTAPPVELEDRHVGSGTADEKEEKHGCNGHVEIYGRRATESSIGWRIGGTVTLWTLRDLANVLRIMYVRSYLESRRSLQVFSGILLTL